MIKTDNTQIVIEKHGHITAVSTVLRKPPHNPTLNPLGLTGVLATSKEEAKETGSRRSYRVRQGPGEQVEGGKTESAETDGVGRREWNLVQLDMRYNTGRGEIIGCKERCISVLGWRMGRDLGHGG